VDSRVGAGTTFRVYLPRVEAPLPPAAPAAALERRGAVGTALLVEDDNALREMIGEILEQSGWTVVSAGTPDEALAIASARPSPFDVLITDVVLPRMRGRELAGQLRGRHPQARVLYISGHPEDPLADGLAGPGTRFLQKPFTRAGLLDALEELLDR
jgi:two-component system cell cycle sensor histidine kinase/response regulator CckA